MGGSVPDQTQVERSYRSGIPSGAPVAAELLVVEIQAADREVRKIHPVIVIKIIG